MGEIDIIPCDTTVVMPEAKFVVQESDEPDAMVPQQEVSVYGPGDTRHTHTVGGQQIGCFGMLVMWFMFRKQEKVRERRKSLISRNRGFRAEFRNKLKTRTMSALSVASTNWRQSRMNLATSTTNLNLRTRHQSHSDPSAPVGVAGRRRHLSMQDRVELYNTALELDTEAEEAATARPRVRKSSKVMFEAPRPALEVTAEGVRVVERVVEAEVQQEPPPASARTRKVSKVSMFEFVPEEN